jgi:hypothetical protein
MKVVADGGVTDLDHVDAAELRLVSPNPATAPADLLQYTRTGTNTTTILLTPIQPVNIIDYVTENAGGGGADGGTGDALKLDTQITAAFPSVAWKVQWRGCFKAKGKYGYLEPYIGM